MAIDIQKLNEKQAQIIAEKQAAKSGDPYAIYENRLAEKTKFIIKFDYSDVDGNLYFPDDNGIWLKLPISALQATDQYYDRYKRGNYIGIKDLEVMVDRIDKEEGIVLLKSGHTTEGIVRGVVRTLDARVKAAYEARKEGRVLEPFDIYGTIAYVDESREYAYVNIFNQKIRGIIHISEWTDAYTRQFPEGIEDTGDPVHFDLIGTMKKEGRKYYRLSTRRFGAEEWDKLPMHIQQGGLVTVTCTDTSNPKYWYGIAKGFSVEWRGNYTNKFTIKEGMQYNVTLKRVNSGDHSIWMVPFKYIKSEVEENESFGRDGIGLHKEDLSRLLEEKRKAAKKAALEKQAAEKVNSGPEGLTALAGIDTTEGDK